jgi:nucleoside-triphosphatase
MDGIAVDCLMRAMVDKDIVVIDEIGPMELRSKKFREVVMQVLESEVTVLGSIVKRGSDFTDAIKRHPNVQVIEIDRTNREQVQADIVGWLQKAGRFEVEDTDMGERP